MEAVVEFQAYSLSRNLFLVKELAIIPLTRYSVKPTIFLFKPPYSWNKLFPEEKKKNWYAEKKLHKISWDSGSIPPENLVKILHNNLEYVKKIYTKGSLKQKYLQNLLPDM